MKIEFTEAEVSAALVDWLKVFRPEVYAQAKDRDATLYCEVKYGELVACGFEVDD